MSEKLSNYPNQVTDWFRVWCFDRKVNCIYQTASVSKDLLLFALRLPQDLIQSSLNSLEEFTGLQCPSLTLHVWVGGRQERFNQHKFFSSGEWNLIFYAYDPMNMCSPLWHRLNFFQVTQGGTKKQVLVPYWPIPVKLWSLSMSLMQEGRQLVIYSC